MQASTGWPKCYSAPVALTAALRTPGEHLTLAVAWSSMTHKPYTSTGNQVVYLWDLSCHQAVFRTHTARQPARTYVLHSARMRTARTSPGRPTGRRCPSRSRRGTRRSGTTACSPQRRGPGTWRGPGLRAGAARAGGEHNRRVTFPKNSVTLDEPPWHIMGMPVGTDLEDNVPVPARQQWLRLHADVPGSNSRHRPAKGTARCRPAAAAANRLR